MCMQLNVNRTYEQVSTDREHQTNHASVVTVTTVIQVTMGTRYREASAGSGKRPIY